MTTRRTSNYNHILNMVLMNTISMRFSAALFLFGASVAAGVGCQFASSVDRNLIPGEGGSGGANQGGGGSNPGGGSSEGGGGGNQGGGGSAPTCTDGATNGDETDTDCGGGTCPACASGLACAANTDCASAKCSGTVCVDGLLISEVQSRGAAGAGDEFIELHNPTSAPITTDATWRIVVRDVPGNGSCADRMDVVLWTGSGETIPSHKFLLIGGAAYAGANAADLATTAPFSDAASLRLEQGPGVADAVCFSFNANTQDELLTCDPAYVCEGTPITNPHNNTNGSNNNASLERKPGNVGGSGIDTGDNSADFQAISPSLPQNSNSLPLP